MRKPKHGTEPRKTFARALGGSAKFSPVPEASAFSKHVADIRDCLQEMRYVIPLAEVAADCEGRRKEMLDMLCRVDLAHPHQT